MGTYFGLVSNPLIFTEFIISVDLKILFEINRGYLYITLLVILLTLVGLIA